MENWQRLVILIFALLLAAGLDYTGRSMHQSLGGDRKFYTFMMPDPGNRQVILFGRAYGEYQAPALWHRLSGLTSDYAPVLAYGDHQLFYDGQRAASLWGQGMGTVKEPLRSKLLSSRSMARYLLVVWGRPAESSAQDLALKLASLLLSAWGRLSGFGLRCVRQGWSSPGLFRR